MFQEQALELGQGDWLIVHGQVAGGSGTAEEAEQAVAALAHGLLQVGAASDPLRDVRTVGPDAIDQLFQRPVGLLALVSGEGPHPAPGMDGEALGPAT